ncbi:MAG: hypothetical protein PHY14_04645 [Candidatus Gracilibacteria bacterium]|nr:hypothetical protein [Candidatus Gracilibacteria bacterium]
MIKKDTLVAYTKGEIQPTDIAHRQEKLLGSNCRAVVLMNFIEDGRAIRVLVKKSRLGSEKLEEVREEYRKLRHYLGDIVPMQAFVSEKPGEIEGTHELITAFCSPVTIAYDVFGSEQNFEFLVRELEYNHDLQNDIDLFICGYRSLKKEGFTIDLYGDENLIVTRDGRLKYIDSFDINMTGRKAFQGNSESRFQKLKTLGTLNK